MYLSTYKDFGEKKSLVQYSWTVPFRSDADWEKKKEQHSEGKQGRDGENRHGERNNTGAKVNSLRADERVNKPTAYVLHPPLLEMQKDRRV